MSTIKDKNPVELAQQVSAFMAKTDLAAESLGIKLEEVKPGYSRMSMLVTKEMLNGFAILHGGITFTFADTAFAHACNSRNQKTVALSCNIIFSASAKEGDHLVAVAEEKSLKGRTGAYDVEVKNQNDELIALFRGTSYRTKDPVVGE